MLTEYVILYVTKETGKENNSLLSCFFEEHYKLQIIYTGENTKL